MHEFYGFRFDPTFSLGTIINLLLFIGVVFGYFQRLERRQNARAAVIDRRLDHLDKCVDTKAAEMDAKVDRLHAENVSEIRVIKAQVGDMWHEFIGRKRR